MAWCLIKQRQLAKDGNLATKPAESRTEQCTWGHAKFALCANETYIYMCHVKSGSSRTASHDYTLFLTSVSSRQTRPPKVNVSAQCNSCEMIRTVSRNACRYEGTSKSFRTES